MTYELWNTETGNAVGEYSTEHDALDAVRDALRVYGDGYVHDLTLAVEDDHGNTLAIAGGADLIQRALVVIA